jgi:hypothetical protein
MEVAAIGITRRLGACQVSDLTEPSEADSGQGPDTHEVGLGRQDSLSWSIRSNSA